MAQSQTHQEIEATLGQVPSWMGSIADPATDHSWGIFRDLILGETELSAREKAIAGLAVASAIKCPYCVHFHTEEAKLAGVTDSELEETATLAGTTTYFSTVLHGNDTDLDQFVEETGEIVDHLKDQEAAAADD